MVVGSSLRRHPKALRSGNIRPDVDEPLSLRAKRLRAASLHDREKAHKRRKVNDSLPPPLQIPLRGRTQPSAQQPESGPGAVTPPKSLDSPTPKPQYDQIRFIEEQARASIRDARSQTTSYEDRRKLRSEHGGSRSKTELSQYFPSFEEMLSLDPPDPEVLTGKTKIILIDDTPGYEPSPPREDPFGSRKPLHKTQILELPILKTSKQEQGVDPLSEEIYMKIHRKAERHEKQMKNGDKERAQHEKYQLERLLDDLRGPDWLKTLGISGITETEKKRYEPKRALFIRETQALIDKFKWWKEEEKRRKLERDQALLEEAAEVEKEESGDEEAHDSSRSPSTQAPDSSEIDALASQQLLEEVKSANKRKKLAGPEPLLLPFPPVHKPFTSFFSKRHLRDAAVSGRQRGRTVLAFGHPVPELEDLDFELPDEILTEDAIRASQRSRRRRRRDVEE